ncbi:MAG: hypothetical protein LBI02_02135 [Opitutaceae bacterium]|nr:hypothetical protein [Opitutaceae bacterium]
MGHGARPCAAYWVCRDWLEAVRIRAVEIVSIDREAREARVAWREGSFRIVKQWPVPFSQLASRQQKAVRLAWTLLRKHLFPAAGDAANRAPNTCTKTASPAATQPQPLTA